MRLCSITTDAKTRFHNLWKLQKNKNQIIKVLWHPELLVFPKSCFFLTLKAFDEMQCLLFFSIEREEVGYGIYPASTWCLLANEIPRILLMRDKSRYFSKLDETNLLWRFGIKHFYKHIFIKICTVRSPLHLTIIHKKMIKEIVLPFLKFLVKSWQHTWSMIGWWVHW